ncbi:MAG: DMT family transporter [Steroidobacteraceae bacterium]
MAAEPPRAPRTLGLIFAALGALGFAFKAIFVKSAYAYGVDATTLLALRMAYSLPLFLLMGYAAQRSAPLRLTGADWRELLALGFLGYYLSSYLDFLGLKYITASLERVILFIYPTLVVLISALLKGRRLSGRLVAALALSYVGVALVVVNDLHTEAGRIEFGAPLVFASALTYALYMIRAGSILQRLGAARVAAGATGIACVLSLVQFALLRPLHDLAQVWQVQALSLSMAVFSTVLPIWMVSEAMRRLGAGPTAIVASLGPVFTLLLAGALLHEPITLLQLAGSALVMLGVRLVSQLKG